MSTEAKQQVKVDRKILTFSNLDKVFYRTGFTKGEVLDYYSRISPWMLPHLRDRMVTLKRFPDGADGNFFYEKRCPAYKPSWVKTRTVKSTHEKEDIPYCQIDSRPALLWMANLASIEFHILLSTTKKLKDHTAMVFDLDPGPGLQFSDCCRLGLKMRDFLEVLKLKSYPKTSGKKGLHLYVPFNTPVDADEAKEFAHQFALTLAQKYPQEVTADMKKVKRKNRVFIDWSQNDVHKTTVCVYSLRAAEKPFVSTPLDWKEVTGCSKDKNNEKYQFTSDQVLERVKKKGDLFKEVLTLKQKLPK